MFRIVIAKSAPSFRLQTAVSNQRRSIILLTDVKVRGRVQSRSLSLTISQYTAHATASGAGRNGRVKSDEGVPFDLKLATPKALKGKGDGQNPEQLFAMGYACKHLRTLSREYIT